MNDPDPLVHDEHPNPDDADTVMAAIVDARHALDKLTAVALGAQCPGCDPAGRRADQIGLDLFQRFDADVIEADFLLADAADARSALRGLLISACLHDHDDSGEHQ